MVYNYRLSLLLLVWPEIDAQLPQLSWLGSCVHWLSNPVRESLKFIVSRITILERVRFTKENILDITASHVWCDKICPQAVRSACICLL